MKRSLQKFLLAAAFLLAATSELDAAPFSFIHNGIYYNYSSGNNCVVTSKYNGRYSGNIIIPEFTYDDYGYQYKVIGIYENAFKKCTGLTSITLPNSLTSIGESAFEGCTGLTSITIPDAVTSIGYETFANCSSLKSIDIPDSVYSIGTGAFRECNSLKEVFIPSYVGSLGEGSFFGCKQLEKLIIFSYIDSPVDLFTYGYTTSAYGKIYATPQTLKNIDVSSSRKIPLFKVEEDIKFKSIGFKLSDVCDIINCKMYNSMGTRLNRQTVGIKFPTWNGILSMVLTAL